MCEISVGLKCQRWPGWQVEEEERGASVWPIGTRGGCEERRVKKKKKKGSDHFKWELGNVKVSGERSLKYENSLSWCFWLNTEQKAMIYISSPPRKSPTTCHTCQDKLQETFFVNSNKFAHVIVNSGWVRQRSLWQSVLFQSSILICIISLLSAVTAVTSPSFPLLRGLSSALWQRASVLSSVKFRCDIRRDTKALRQPDFTPDQMTTFIEEKQWGGYYNMGCYVFRMPFFFSNVLERWHF